MKNLIYMLVSIVLVSSCSSAKKAIVVSDSNKSYRIKEINKNNFWYIIYAERKDTLFKIVSYSENSINEGFKKIVVGGRYDFELKSKKENAPIIGVVKLDPLGYTGCYQYDKETTICFESKRGIFDLFYTNDLKGIYYLK